MNKTKIYWRQFPFPILLCLLCLSTISLLFIDSAAYNRNLNQTLPYAKKQLAFLTLCLATLTSLLFLPYQLIKNYAWWAYLLGILGLIAVFFLGKSAKGAARWIPLGPIRVQPSEFMKLALVLGLAKHLSHRNLSTYKSLIPPFCLTLLPMILVLKQPDLGTSLLFLPLLFSLLYVQGAPTKHLLTIALALLLTTPIAWFTILKDYQKNRIYAFLYPEKYKHTIAYQTIQSQIAIGSGGLWGKGRKQGTQSQLNFLPERHTDFIFAVISEEWGLIGASSTLLLLLILITLLLELAAKQTDPFAKLYCTGIGVLIALQVGMNVGIATGIMPVTGLTLPFLSYGGSSSLMFWSALGIAFNISLRTRLNS